MSLEAPPSRSRLWSGVFAALLVVLIAVGVTVLVVGSGLAGASAAATLAELGYKVKWSGLDPDNAEILRV